MRAQIIRERLQQALQPEYLELIDEGHLHIGHEGAKTGKGHFRLHIIAQCFTGLRPAARHQLIYQALDTLFTTDIHALSIHALAPAETSHTIST